MKCIFSFLVAIHIVTRPPETNTVQQTPNESATLTEPIVEARVISSNLIVGNVSFERTGLFDEPDQTSVSYCDS